MQCVSLPDLEHSVLQEAERLGLTRRRMSMCCRKGETVALKPINLLLPPGSAVVIVGVTGAPELNGRKGTAQGFNEAKGRYKVHVVDEPRPKMLKPDNCRLLIGLSDGDCDL